MVGLKPKLKPNALSLHFYASYVSDWSLV